MDRMPDKGSAEVTVLHDLCTSVKARICTGIEAYFLEGEKLRVETETHKILPEDKCRKCFPAHKIIAYTKSLTSITGPIPHLVTT